MPGDNETAPPRDGEGRYRPELDGIRGIAVLLVLAAGCAGSADASAPPIFWTVIDVPITWQGDAHLLTDGVTHVLVDTGAPDSTEAAVIPFLREQGIDRLDYVFISHAHIDHAEGIGTLADHVGIGIIVVATIPDACAMDDPHACDPQRLQAALDHATDRGARIIAPKTGMAWAFSPRFSITIIDAPSAGEVRPDVNSYSVIMRADMNGTTALFTGDMTTWQARTLEPPRADILKLPHHGLDTELPDGWDAGISVVSVNADLWCGPRAASLHGQFPGAYVTGLHGHITIIIDEGVAVTHPAGRSC